MFDISRTGKEMLDLQDKLAERYKYKKQHGAFIEISPDDMVMDSIVVKRGQEYRINNPKYSERVKYQWFTARDRSDCKLYFQQKGVTYADYKPNKWYISPFEVCTLEEIKAMNI